MPISDAAASLFYDRLFELDPSVKPLFKSDMGEQKKKLMQTLTVAVDGLRNLPKLVPVLQALGVRHAGYMVQDHHYDVVGAALLWTLREGLGDDFTDEVEDAWKEIYTLVADVMKKAAAEHTGARAGVGAAPRSARSASEARSDPPAEDLVATLHYESSKKPALDADGLDEPEHEYAPDVAAPRRAPAGYAPAYAPAYGPQAPPVGGIVVPLSGQEVTLNVRVNVDTPPTLMARGATAVEPPPQGGLAPALFLSVLCVVASMALTVMGPNFGGRGDTAGAFVVPLGVLLLTGSAFGLGYQWGRGRRASGSDARR
jgi:hemoglobin-like flavoprotein